MLLNKRTILKLKHKYQLLFFILFLSVNPTSQGQQIKVERVPFVDVDAQEIMGFHQDTTGLIWLESSENWFISDGEKIMKTQKPFSLEDSRVVYGINSGAPNGYIYLGGDSFRLFNPYDRTILQTIGLDKKYDTNGQTPRFWYFMQPSDSIMWAMLVSHGINDDNQLVRGNTVMQSRNGAPFVKVVNTPHFLYSQSMAIRGKQLFLTSNDTIWQYNIDGKLDRVYPLPSISAVPLVAENLVAEKDNVQFFHYIQNKTTGELDRAIYELAPSSEELKSIVVPELNGISCHSFYRSGKYYWLEGAETSFHYFSLENKEVIDYSRFILQQHPDLSYFGSSIGGMFEDRTGIIWVSTFNDWVLKISSTQNPFTRILGERRQYPFCEFETCVIRGMTSDEKGNIYFAYDFGIQKLNPSSGQLSPVKINTPDKLKAANSLTYYNNKLFLNDLEIDPNTGNVRALFPGIESGLKPHYIDTLTGQMWLSDSGSGNNVQINLYHYDLKNGKASIIGRLKGSRNYQNEVSQFHLSPTTQTVFVASLGNGLCEIDSMGNISEFITADKSKIKSDSLPTIYAIYEDDNHQLWIGHTAGLSRFDLKSRDFVRKANKGTSLGSTRIFSIQRENETYCWLGTARGIYRLNVETGEIRNFQMFPFQARMEFNRLSTYQSPEGRMYFGSVEGIFAFHPSELVNTAQLNKQFPVQLSKFSVFDIKQDTIVHLDFRLATTNIFDIYPHHKYFTLEVYVPDFRDASNNTYKWWLEGYDSRWSSPTTTNTIRYDNLDPGTYTLYIRGGITSDYYGSSERKIQIIVHQAWYKTWWAYCLYFGTFLWLVYLMYQYQIKQQLEKAEGKRLKELDSLKTRLYTNITHEFRTPLTVIMGMTDNIRGHQNEKKLISRNSENLLRLVNQLLDLSKLDSGTMKMDFIQADIINYLQYLTESFYSMAEEKKIRLMFYSEVKGLVMDFDEVKIQHIIYNLLSNAIKFSKSGDKVILHATKAESNGHPHLKLKVTDTGIGISEKDLEHIFDRFYQADATSTRKGEGTGIGLALTKELVEAMGGKISVESQLEEGTEFLILLPIQRDAEMTQIETALPPSRMVKQELVTELMVEGTEPRTSLKEKPHLLIIEDNRDVTTYMSNLLRKEYQVMTALNGKEGVEKALETIPDIIISDVMMPEMDGYEVSRTLKNDERTCHIPIILLTAKAAADDRIEGLEMGADAFLTKPFNKKELFVRLEQLVKLRQKLQVQYAAFKITSVGKPSLDEAFLQKLITAVEERLDDPDFGVIHLCRAANLSNMQVNRKLKALTGKTPSRFIRSIRLRKGMELLKTTDLNISEIAYEVGFSDPNYFSRSFSEEFGHSPNVMRN